MKFLSMCLVFLLCTVTVMPQGMRTLFNKDLCTPWPGYVCGRSRSTCKNFENNCVMNIQNEHPIDNGYSTVDESFCSGLPVNESRDC